MVNVNKDNESPKIKVSSVSEFLARIAEIANKDDNSTRFFRGQSNSSWEIKPGIYRDDNPNLIHHEHNIISEAFISCPDEFIDDKYLFDKLVRLQHYGYPTRLLDLTYNALVALYFSLGEKDKDNDDQSVKENVNYSPDGKVFILDIPNNSIKYRDSDTVSILSAISIKNELNIRTIKEESEHYQKELYFHYLLAQEKKEEFKEQLSNNIEENMNEEHEKKKTPCEEVNQYIAKIEKHNRENYLNDLPIGSIPTTEKIIIEATNKHKDLISIAHSVKNDKPGFQNIIDINDLAKTLCVKASMNNQRIARQQGAFLLFGIDEKDGKSKPSEIPNDWIIEEIIIDATKKDDIRKELAQLGIHDSFLFPELERQADYIKEKYKTAKEGM